MKPTTSGQILAVIALVTSSCTSVDKAPIPRNPLATVQTWAVQLQGLDKPASVDSIRRARVDMVVVEPTDTVRGMQNFSSESLVKTLRNSKGSSREQKLCVAYLNIGQAEDYRRYWHKSWQAPTADKPGHPDFLVTLDPDGWPGNYPCKYWDERWQRVLFGTPDALLDRILAAGFDGIYMDWILGYCEPAIQRAALRDDVDAAAAMVELIGTMRDYARSKNPDFVLIAQNGAELASRDARFLGVIDGLSHEDLSFRGEASAQWHDAKSGGIDARVERIGSSASREDPLLIHLDKIRSSGLPVFTLDYAVSPRDVRNATKRSRDAGFVPTVSRTPLDRLPSHIEVAGPAR